MTLPVRQGDAIAEDANELPLVRYLSPEARRGGLLGVAIAGGVLLIVGGFLGGLNRESTGALIGALSGSVLGILLGGIAGMVLGVLLPAQQARATMAIELDRNDDHYLPGDRVSGHLVLFAQNTFRAKGAKVFFICRGFYAHDKASTSDPETPESARQTRQYLIQQTELLPAGIVRRNANLRYPFEFDVPPDALPTNHGYACAIHWTLHAVLDAPGDVAIKTQQELYVRSKSASFGAIESEYRSAASSRLGQITLTLPHVVYAEGEAVRGEAHISPSDTFVAEQVRAVLLRVENTPVGDDHIVYVGRWDPGTGQFRGRRQPGGQGTTYVWLEDEVPLGGGQAFEVGKPVTWPVKLAVPAQWRPTLSTKDGKVNWKVGFVVSCSDREDLRCFHEVIVHTGPPHLDKLLGVPDAISVLGERRRSL